MASLTGLKATKQEAKSQSRGKTRLGYQSASAKCKSVDDTRYQRLVIMLGEMQACFSMLFNARPSL